jgi:hypothetical protein
MPGMSEGNGVAVLKEEVVESGHVFRLGVHRYATVDTVDQWAGHINGEPCLAEVECPHAAMAALRGLARQKGLAL